MDKINDWMNSRWRGCMPVGLAHCTRDGLPHADETAPEHELGTKREDEKVNRLGG